MIGLAITIALAGDTMLGRGVAGVLRDAAPEHLVGDELAELMHAADLRFLNLECCVSARGRRWPDPAKPFFFRAPPEAVGLLTHLGVDAVTLANNHALDYGHEALLDTFEHLDGAGIRWVGAGVDVEAARRPISFERNGLRVTLVALTDHPADYAAAEDTPGVAYADLRRSVPGWVRDLAGGDDLRVVTPHWGPNMVASPTRHVLRAADSILDAGATMIAGHSAHVFHGVHLAPDPPRAVLYDLGDFIDDYAVDPELRNDFGLLWLVTLDAGGPTRVEAVPLRLDYAFTDLAAGAERAEIVDRLSSACRSFGSTVEDTGTGLLVRAG